MRPHRLAHHVLWVILGEQPESAAYRWSSARAHLANQDEGRLLDPERWTHHAPSPWQRVLAGGLDRELEKDLCRCTYAGRPFGSGEFVSEMAARFERHWERGRPPRPPAAARSGAGAAAQMNWPLG